MGTPQSRDNDAPEPNWVARSLRSSMRSLGPLAVVMRSRQPVGMLSIPRLMLNWGGSHLQPSHSNEYVLNEATESAI